MGLTGRIRALDSGGENPLQPADAKEACSAAIVELVTRRCSCTMIMDAPWGEECMNRFAEDQAVALYVTTFTGGSRYPAGN